MSSEKINVPTETGHNPETVPTEAAHSPEILLQQQQEQQSLEAHKAVQTTKDAAEIEKVRQELGIAPATEGDRDAIVRLEQVRQREFLDGLKLVSADLQQFRDTLRRNKFKLAPFDAAGLDRVILGEFDPKSLAESLRQITNNLRRDMLPSGDDRFDLEPHNYTQAMDALGTLKGTFIGLRNRLDQNKLSDNQADITMIRNEIGNTLTALRKQNDFLEEMQLMLRRIRER